MIAITTEQSEQIGREIFAQAAALSDIADTFAPPWGLEHRKRATRLYRARMNVAFHFEQLEIA